VTLRAVLPAGRVRRPLAALACALALAACDARANEAGAPASSSTSTTTTTPGETRAPAEARTAGGAAFTVTYGPVEDPTFAQWQSDFRQMRFLEEIAAALNGMFILPQPVAMRFEECGEPNAFYEPAERAILVCFELVDELDQIFARDDDADRAVNDALLFTILHEAGHALIDVLQLPVAGREEDAADQLAAIILVDGTPEGVVAAINGVRGLPEDAPELDESALAGEHSLTSQRYYNVLCLIYGSDPDTYIGWAEDGTLPLERAARCPAEYERTLTSWQRLLGPALREG
jgi:Putative metallopeptidase